MSTLLLTLSVALLASWLWRHRDRLSGWRRLGALLGLVSLLALGLAIGPRGLLLQKVLGRLVMPVGLIWLALSASALWSWHLGRRRAALWLLALWLGFTVAGNDLVAASWMGWLQRDFQAIRPMDQEPFDAVLVLGGGTETTAAGEVALAPSGDRVMLAARMYHAGLARALVASGDSIEGLGPPRRAGEETAEIWRSLGIPPSAIVVLAGSRNTSEEVASYRRLVSRRGWSRVGLITSAWHLRRAMGRCRSQELEVSPLPADPRLPPFYSGLFSLIPNGESFWDVQLAAWETLGSAIGR